MQCCLYLKINAEIKYQTKILNLISQPNPRTARPRQGSLSCFMTLQLFHQPAPDLINFTGSTTAVIGVVLRSWAEGSMSTHCSGYLCLIHSCLAPLWGSLCLLKVLRPPQVSALGNPRITSARNRLKAFH